MPFIVTPPAGPKLKLMECQVTDKVTHMTWTGASLELERGFRKAVVLFRIIGGGERFC